MWPNQPEASTVFQIPFPAFWNGVRTSDEAWQAQSPTRRQSHATKAPCARSTLILAVSTTTYGLPSFFPFERAFRSPAFTRSTMTSLQLGNGAKDREDHLSGRRGRCRVAPNRLTNSIPSAGKVSKALRRCDRTRESSNHTPQRLPNRRVKRKSETADQVPARFPWSRKCHVDILARNSHPRRWQYSKFAEQTRAGLAVLAVETRSVNGSSRPRQAISHVAQALR